MHVYTHTYILVDESYVPVILRTLVVPVLTVLSHTKNRCNILVVLR